MAVQEISKRILFRREIASFQAAFYADALNTIPLVPLDAGRYPSYTIYDISNTAIQTGVASQFGSAGNYKVEFQVPEDAALSLDLSRWRIEWTLVSDDNRQVNFVEDFDVRDQNITASFNREQKFITLCDNTYRAMLRLTNQPHEVLMDVYVGASQRKIVTDASVSTNPAIVIAADGDSYVYYYDIQSTLLKPNQFFSIIWKIRETQFDVQQFTFQSLSSVSINILNMVTSIRMLIDKFQKKLDVVQAFQDSDIVEYIARAHNMVNSAYPTSFYSFGAMPTSLNTFIVMYASWYGLQAQGLLEVDLAFNFSGQSVTMDYDHNAALGEIASRWYDYIDKNLPPAKMTIKRMTTAVGNVAGRPYRYSQQYMTYKVASYQSDGNNIIGMLNNLGLLW